MVFEDVKKEPCLIANPNVIRDMGLRFYANVPMITHDEFLIGTLCIIYKINRITDSDWETLEELAKTTMNQIELMRSSLDKIDRLRTTNDYLDTASIDLA
ncbi:GAF domain-containing protein [Chryseobacterium formosus]|uniref:GAF domain-containing protein n=1 Tax=Chryseobacterium formosus TaxID=1537363 RepID=A0ABT3XXP3_9FLAO|nr:GAF domain-containing protein [Chryseobacterium formosus]MCX8526444.1 GAF domain-containing protein [Chryseobacterium formosus]